MQQLTIITEKGRGNDIWGRIHYGHDLLTSVAQDLDQLKANFLDQLEGFYSIAPAYVQFNIVEGDSLPEQ